MYLVIGYPKQGLKGFYMLIVLVQRILELIGLTVYFLRPRFLFGASEYPAAHIFGLDHEDAIFGEDNLIYLGSSFACWKSNVLDEMVILFI